MAKYHNGLEDKLVLTENQMTVLEKRYLIKDLDGKVVETGEALFRRVADYISQPELKYNEKADVKSVSDLYYKMMSNFEFMPNSPTLMNAGRELGQLSGCYVLPIEDSMESIFDNLKYAALIHKSGGGTGFDFSELRPKNDPVKSTSGVSSGPVSFMKVYNAATEAIKQGGTRRGANMGILRVDHPDILEFIVCKDKEMELNNFNISVALTDKFMYSLHNNQDYELINPKTKKVVGKLNAREVYDKIVHQAWKNGEPGIVFIDKINEGNPTPKIGVIKSTNPCGEQPLLSYESCNLGSINLSKFVKEDDVNWNGLEEITKSSVQFLDNVIDMNKFPLPQIENMTKANRKIGLGVMGWADMLTQLKMPYNSDRALGLGEKVMSFMQSKAKEMSAKLAEKRGNFPNYDLSIYKDSGPMRNATLTTIAPTGTISIISNASSGIEPLFGLVYTRENILGNEKLLEINSSFEKKAKERGFYSEELMKKIAETGSIQHLKGIPEDVKKIFVTAHDLSPEDHIKMQAAFQKYTDNAVSKTVNFRHDATKENVREVYDLAYELGCKGVTIYRDKSRDVQVLNTSKTESKPKRGGAIKLPEILPSSYIRFPTPFGKMHLHISVLPQEDYQEVQLFAQIGKGGESKYADLEGMARLSSYMLRSRFSLDDIIEQLIDIGSNKRIEMDNKEVGSLLDGINKTEGKGWISSLPDAIAKGLWMYKTLKEKYGIEKLLLGQIDESHVENMGELKWGEKMPLPKFLPGIYIKQRTPDGNLHLNIDVLPQMNYKEVQVFAQLGKGGKVAYANSEGLTRLSSKLLRSGSTIEGVIDQLKNIGSDERIATKEGGVESLPDGISKGLMKYKAVKDKYGIKDLMLGKVKEEEVVNEAMNIKKTNHREDDVEYAASCPECKDGKIEFKEGCATCNSCGYSKC